MSVMTATSMIVQATWLEPLLPPQALGAGRLLPSEMTMGVYTLVEDVVGVVSSAVEL